MKSENAIFSLVRQCLVATLIAACFSNCAAPLVAYKEQLVEPTATLTIKTGKTDITNGWVIHMKGDMQKYSCSAEPEEVIAILNNKSIFNQFADKGSGASEVSIKIPANGEAFRFFIPFVAIDLGASDVTTTTCQAHVGFTPEPGKKYVATYHPAQSACEIPIQMLDADGRTKDASWKSYPPCLDKMGRNFTRESFVRDYYNKHQSEYDGK